MNHRQRLFKPNAAFEYIYPPLPAILLAIPSYFGKIPLYLCLCALNIAAWWMTAQLSNAMTGDGKIPNPWLAALPSIVTISFIFDMFDLGQPNLVLLALMMLGFWLLQNNRPWSSGGLFAIATAIKVFPVAVLPYLVWRRQWASAASMMIFLVILLFVVPVPMRGFQHNLSELKTWYQGMVGSSSEHGFGQRDDQNWLKTTIATYDPDQDEPVISYVPIDLRYLKPTPRDYSKAKKVIPHFENVPSNIKLPV